MKTLIIHPEDESTAFVKDVYKDIAYDTLIEKDLTKGQIIDQIVLHDKIIMIGHGGPEGMFSVGKFPVTWGYVIDESFVPYFKQKKECLYLWCNADKFVQKHKLKGFYSGMFISELNETYFCGVEANQKQMDEANEFFCETFQKYLTKDMQEAYNHVKGVYKNKAKDNPIIDYNSKKLYYAY
jgi:hypothetical protein